ncbi:MAG: DUF370 domain-containing protein [Lachnospiraceae bacterium]|jgi:regulator of extracellular matrix RemA (YlzA/DUF370 family)|nr:DUF370 domain-containing protein [Lachnospiraceae bacterium]
MSKLIHIGFGNVVNEDKIVAIVHPDAAPIKRLVSHARETNTVVDATQGRKTKSVIVMEGQQLVLSALLPETIFGRAKKPGETAEDADE